LHADQGLLLLERLSASGDIRLQQLLNNVELASMPACDAPACVEAASFAALPCM